MNNHGRVPVKLYLWIIKFEFHVIFTCHEILFFLCFFSIVWKCKSIFRLQALGHQVADRNWPTLPLPTRKTHLLYELGYSPLVGPTPPREINETAGGALCGFGKASSTAGCPENPLNFELTGPSTQTLWGSGFHRNDVKKKKTKLLNKTTFAVKGSKEKNSTIKLFFVLINKVYQQANG